MAGRQARHDEPVLLEMEAEGRERGFPIVGRNVGVTLEVLARLDRRAPRVRARQRLRVQRLLVRARGGRAARSTAPMATPTTPTQAEAYLARAGLSAIGSRITSATRSSSWPVVDGSSTSCSDDIDKHGLPRRLAAARDRIRVGGLYICDNMLWSAAVSDPGPDHPTAHERDPASTTS